jgi:hypothetical protein
MLPFLSSGHAVKHLLYEFGLIRKSAAVIVENGTRTHIADVLRHDLKKEKVAYQTFKLGGCSKMDARRLMDFAFECLNITRDEEGNLIQTAALFLINSRMITPNA